VRNVVAASVQGHSAKDCATCRLTDCQHAANAGAHHLGQVAVLLAEPQSTVQPEFAALIAHATSKGASVHTLAANDWRTRLTRLMGTLRVRLAKRRAKPVHRAVYARDRALAANLALKLTPAHTQLIVSQALLPHLAALGVLRGRRYEVLMARPPLSDFMASLDRAAALYADSRTLADFRASDDDIALERKALRGAVACHTPHRWIAERLSQLGAHVAQQAWYVKAQERIRPSTDKTTQPIVLFAAPPLARKGAHAVREALIALNQTSSVSLRIINGANESADFFADVPHDIATVNDALWRDVTVAVLPAFVENNPRLLIEAQARGIPVIASDVCGVDLQASDTLVSAGDAEALERALQKTLGLDLADSESALTKIESLSKQYA
jgi:Glycosyl transferases group 1